MTLNWPGLNVRVCGLLVRLANFCCGCTRPLASNNCCRLYFTYFSMKLTNNNKNKQIRLDCFNVTKLYGKSANWSTSQMQTISTVRISVDSGCIDPLNFSCISSTGNHKQ